MSKGKYIVWLLPEVRPEESYDGWLLFAQVETPNEAFIKSLEAKEQGKVMITCQVELKVVLA